MTGGTQEVPGEFQSDLPTFGWRGSQQELDLNSQHGGSLFKAKLELSSQPGKDVLLRQALLYFCIENAGIIPTGC